MAERDYSEIFGPYLVDRLSLSDGGVRHFAARRKVDGGMVRACRLRRLDLRRVEDDAVRLRLTDEARLLVGLRHPGIVATLDYGVIDDELFVEEECVDGTTLRQMLDVFGLLVPGIALLITARLAEVLAYAQDAPDADGEPLRVVHRNLQPIHVRITHHGETKLGGFGTAHFRGRLMSTSYEEVQHRVRYTSPEAIRGGVVDGRSDLFGLGILLYEMLTGRVPFPVSSFEEARTCLATAEHEPLETHLGDIDPRVSALVEELLRADPAARPDSALEVWRSCWALRRSIGDPRDEGRLRGLVSRALAPGDDLSFDDG